jgi:hypothetical protein
MPLDIDDGTAVDEMFKTLQERPELITVELADKIYKLALKAIENPEETSTLVDLINIAMFAKIATVKNGSPKSEVQNELNLLTNRTSELVEKAIKNLNFDRNSSYLLGNSMYVAQISTSNLQSTEDANKIALENRLAIVDLTDCIKTLKKWYGINESTDIIILKTDLSSNLDLENLDNPMKSNSVEFKVFDSESRTELDISICQNEIFQFKTPIKEIELLDMPMYHNMTTSGIDIYNPNADAYNSVCFTHVDVENQYDTTLGWRRNNYFQNKSATCTSTASCTYNYIDGYNYVNCNCTNWKNNTQVGNDFIDFLFSPISNWNFQVLTCNNLIIPVKF